MSKPKLKINKTYEARRGRRTYKILGATKRFNGTYEYEVEETLPHNKKRMAKYLEDVLLDLARLKKRGGDQVYLSASQLGTFQRCKKKWAFTYINGVMPPDTAATEFGTEMHAVIEHYLKTGQWRGAEDAIACAKQGLAELPAAPCSKEIGIEREITIDLPTKNGPARFLGYIDLLEPPSMTDDGKLRVSDHKSTKNLRYAKRPEDLGADVQANIYTKWALDEYNVDEANLVWRYYAATPSCSKDAVQGRPRNTSGYRLVELSKKRKDVERYWEEIVNMAEEMVGYVNNPEIWAEDIDGNLEACSDYGRCPFLDRCNVSCGGLAGLFKSEQTKDKTKGKKKMSALMDYINEKQGKKPKPKPEPKPEPKEKESKLEALAKRQAKDGAQGVNPPPVEEKELDPVLQAAMKPSIPDTWYARLKKGHKARGEDEQKWRDEIQAEQGPKQEEPKQEEPKREEPKQEVKVIHVDDPPAPVPKTFTLYIDCHIEKGDNNALIDLSTWLTPLKRKLEEDQNIKYWNVMDYRKGEQLLAAYLRAYIETMMSEPDVMINEFPDAPLKRLPDSVYIDSKTIEWKACADVLMESATEVIRGLA